MKKQIRIEEALSKKTRKKRNVVERFLESFEIKDNGCWEWKKINASHKYGTFTINKVIILAHRFSYFFYKGNIPEGMEICHKCDNRRCVNPNHLFLGTHYDNMHDAIKKNKITHEKGETHARAKLTEKEVYEIKGLLKNGMMQRRIAEKYGVHEETIRCIKIGRNWRHLK